LKEMLHEEKTAGLKLKESFKHQKENIQGLAADNERLKQVGNGRKCSGGSSIDRSTCSGG